MDVSIVLDMARRQLSPRERAASWTAVGRWSHDGRRAAEKVGADRDVLVLTPDRVLLLATRPAWLSGLPRRTSRRIADDFLSVHRHDVRWLRHSEEGGDLWLTIERAGRPERFRVDDALGDLDAWRERVGLYARGVDPSGASLLGRIDSAA